MAKKVVLAYSGGLDTSIILKWLQEERRCEVVAFTADLGQGEELNPAQARAESLGAVKVVVRDLREEFVRDYVFPVLRAGAVYEHDYLLGSAIARPLIARHLVDLAAALSADAVAHGATGKGNDQVRFELGVYALNPSIKVIAPWREWSFDSRSSLLAYAERHGIEIEKSPTGESPYSMDANLLHVSYEGGCLEDPWQEPPAAMWKLSCPIEQTPDDPEYLEIDFERGNPTALDGKPMTPAVLLAALNQAAGRHGIGRVDMVENRYLGLKSRGCYETPGGTLLWTAHRALESLALDREEQHLQDDLRPRYARLIYNGYWWSPERMHLQALFDDVQTHVGGTVRLKLYKGSGTVVGRRAQNALYDEKLSSFESDGGAYRQADASGFIKLNALRLKTIAGSRRTARSKQGKS